MALADILTQYKLLTALRESAHGYEGSCPFCGSDSFKANTEKNVWFCFGTCKEREKKNGGNILDFVSRREGVSITVAAARVNEWFPDKENGTEDQNVTEEASGDAAEVRAGEGDATPLPESETAPTDDSAEPISPDAKNKPLPFTLQHLDAAHSFLTETLGFSEATMAHFGVGHFAGKGIMHNRIAIPIHNRDGQLVAYAGLSPTDGTYTYPKTFHRECELFNSYRVGVSYDKQEPLILVADYLDVFRLYEAGYQSVVALPTAILSLPQKTQLLELIGVGGRITLFVAHEYPKVVELLSDLIVLFHVRLVRFVPKKDSFIRFGEEDVQILLDSIPSM